VCFQFTVLTAVHFQNANAKFHKVGYRHYSGEAENVYISVQQICNGSGFVDCISKKHFGMFFGSQCRMPAVFRGATVMRWYHLLGLKLSHVQLHCQMQLSSCVQAFDCYFLRFHVLTSLSTKTKHTSFPVVTHTWLGSLSVTIKVVIINNLMIYSCWMLS